MKLKDIGTIIGWIGLFVALASLGFIADVPSMGQNTEAIAAQGGGQPLADAAPVGRMVPWYGVFFIAVFGLMFLWEKRKHAKHDDTTDKFKKFKPLVGIGLLAAAIATPTILFASAGFSLMINVMLGVIVIALIMLGTVAVIIMNKSTSLKLIGYLLIVGISTVPGLTMMQYDKSFSALGMAYYAAVAIAILSWWGISMFKKDE